MPTAKKPAPLFTISADGLREMMQAIVADAVDSQLADIKQALEESKDSLYEIKTALTGNGFGVNHGLIFRVGEVEKGLVALQAEVHAERQERRDAAAKLKYTALGIGIGAGLGGGGLALGIAKMFGA